jgi:hypothetical protein
MRGAPAAPKTPSDENLACKANEGEAQAENRQGKRSCKSILRDGGSASLTPYSQALRSDTSQSASMLR